MMPVFQDNSANHPDQGMTEADMQATARVAAARNEIIMFRDTGCWSRPYIERGHPTKPFHVKGKSSDWGPHAGLVPYDSEFSKAFTAAAISKGFKLNKEAIAGNFARPVKAYVTEEFIQDELLVPKGSRGNRPVDRVTHPRDGVIYFFCTKPNDDPHLPGKPYVLLGKKAGARIQLFTFPLKAATVPEKQLFLLEAEAQPLLVMTVPGADLPITGDYDLFAVCPSWDSYGALDKKMDPTLDNPEQNRSFKRTRNPVSIERINAAFTPEDPDRGNLTGRLVQVIRALQLAMVGAYPRVHHNAESGRPFAPGAEDGFPLTTFHPHRGIGGYTFLNATINDIGDLRDYFTRIYHDGYYPPRNHAWQMRSLRDDSAVKGQLTRIFAGRGRNAT